MNLDEHLSRVSMIHAYFKSDYKWKENEAGEKIYYKSPSRLKKELAFAVGLFFPEYAIGDFTTFATLEGEPIGYEVSASIVVDPAFNGFHQGSEPNEVKLTFTLTHHAFWMS